MPMELTPREQVLVAVATKWTGELTVEPFTGLVTATFAKARGEKARAKIATQKAFRGRLFNIFDPLAVQETLRFEAIVWHVQRGDRADQG